jgi:mono/diheme cytochrome c family protein
VKASQLVIAVCLLFFAFTVASGQSRPSDTLTANPAFITNCAKCHGKNAEGRHFRGPALISAKIAAASDDELRNIVSNGKGHMPKYRGKLTSDEIDILVQQIKALDKK